MGVTIPCPACNVGSILIEPRMLASGSRFACNHCGAALAIAPQSVETLERGINAYEKIRTRAASLVEQD
ncbi:hypothetical protein [Alteriqipengyuania sp. 357]